MAPNGRSDALDEIADEVRRWLPDVDLTGLAITGRILRLAHHLEAGREMQLARFGLTAADFDMLATVRRRVGDGAIKIKELQRSLMLSSGGTTKRLDRVEASGLIRRQPDPDDRRGTLIALTLEGLAVINEAVPAVMQYETSVVSAAIASGRDRAVVEDGLRRLLMSHELSTAVDSPSSVETAAER